MTTAELVGVAEPTIWSCPDGDETLAEQAIELATSAGLFLDEWQKFVLRRALRTRPDGKWAAFEVGLMVSRQNGKGAILEALELLLLFLVGNKLTTHSAHQIDTSLEAWLRLKSLIEETPELDERVRRYIATNGQEAIVLRDGRRLRFRTRTKAGGRGFSGQTVILDEAMYLPDTAIASLMPTVSAQPNPQIWYTGSAVDKETNDDGVVFARLRERGRRGDDPSLAWFEWTADADGDPDNTAAHATATDAWAASNPSLGIRIGHEYVANEQRSMSDRVFAVERLGIGDWPDPSQVFGQGLDPEKWAGLKDLDSKPLDPVCFSFDVTPSRSHAAISVSGRRPDGQWHAEVVDHRKGTDWVIPALAKLLEQHDSVEPVCDGASPAAALLAEAENAELEVRVINAREHAQACGGLFDKVEQGTVWWTCHPDLALALLAAVRGAIKRELGDSWAWSRRKSNVDISPLVAVTLALWGAESQIDEHGSVYASRGVTAV